MSQSSSVRAIPDDGNANLNLRLHHHHHPYHHRQTSKSAPSLINSRKSFESEQKGVSQSVDCILKIDTTDAQTSYANEGIEFPFPEVSTKKRLAEQLLQVYPRKSADSVVVPKKISNQTVTEPRASKILDSATSEKELPQSSLNKTKETDYDVNDDFQRMCTSIAEDDRPGNGKRQPRRFLDILICRWRPVHYRRIHQIDVRLFDPPIRSQFFSKVMMVKFIKWIFATAMALLSPYVPHFKEFVTVESWLVTIPICIYFSAFLFLRTTESCQSAAGSFIVLVIYVRYYSKSGSNLKTTCLGFIGSIMYCVFLTALIPTSMLTLSLTYGTLAALTSLTYSDLTRDSIVPSVILVVMSYSLVSFVIGSRMLCLNDSSTVQQFGLIWFPSMMMTQTITLIEIAELKALLDGLRIDLTPYDWMIVAAFLL